MTRHRLRLLALTLLVGLGGCFTIDAPLSDPATAEADKALCGVWTSSEKATPTLAMIGLADAEPGVPAGLMRVVLPRFDAQSRKLEPGRPGCGFVTRINDATYMNLLEAEQDLFVKAHYDAWAAKPERKTILVKYKVDGDRLTVWLGLSPDGYKGFAAKHGITDSAGLAAHLKRSGDAELFPADLDKLTFTRVK